MLSYTDLKPGTKIVLNGEPHIVLEYSFMRKQQRKPVVRTKVRNLISGIVVEKSFQQSDNIEEAAIEAKEVKFLYSHKGEFWFCPPDDPKGRFSLGEKILGSGVKFLKQNSLVKAHVYNDEIIDIELPIKVDLKVVEAPPAVRGNTAQGANKQVVLETGTVLFAPIFISEGDVVRINTQTGEYVERVSKTK